MPRALTEQEKERQYVRLLKRGKEIVLLQGIRKTSVDDIARAADMTKSTFYQHFESKEKFIYAVIMETYRHLFTKADGLLIGTDNIREALSNFIKGLFQMPDMVFAAKYYFEIQEIVDSVTSESEHTSLQTEEGIYERLIDSMGIDTELVKAGVVHNYFHAMYSMVGSGRMIDGCLQETLDLMTEGLVSYILGGVR